MSVRDRAGGAGDDLVVARLHALAPHLDGEPDPAWQATTRARLVAMAAVRRPEPARLSPLRRLLTDGRFPTEGLAVPGRWRTRLTAGLAGAALSITALAVLVAAADAARPGDVLYDLKRGTEQTQLALAGDARGEVLLDLAGTRLDEVRALVDAGTTALPAAGAAGPGGAVLAAGNDAALVVETLATMDAQTADGAAEFTGRAVDSDDTGPLAFLADWVVRQSEGLTGLRDDVPAAAEDDVLDSLTLLADLSTRVGGLESSLACADGPAVLGADELGPVPAPCPSDGSTAQAPGQAGDGSAPGTGVPDPGLAPVPGSSSGPSAPSAPSAGGVAPAVPRTGDGGVPTPAVPPLPSGAVPTPPPVLLPVPTPLPTLPGSLPPPPGAPSPLPGATPALPGVPGAVPTPGSTPPSTVDVCLPPIRIAGC